jgi:hypothetical protein
MAVLGLREQDFLPSVWAEARTTTTLHHDRTNVPQIITRAEADAISHNAAGAIRSTTHETPQMAFRDVNRPRPSNERYPDQNQQRYSAVAKNQGGYHPYDFLSYNYNIAGRGTYNTIPNPAIINKVV